MAPGSVQNAFLDNYQAVVSAFSEFLTVAVHTILYERDIYPRTSFLSARKYNYPVRQNRHPKVCQWIQDAVAAVEAELLKGTVSNTSLIIFSHASIPLERYVFSTENFPIIPPTEHLTTFAFSPPRDVSTDNQPPNIPITTNTPDPNLPTTPPPPLLPARPPTALIDLHAQFRALFARLGPSLGKLSPLPSSCTFTIAIELRDTPRADPPIGHPTAWVAAEPGLQHADASQPQSSASPTSATGVKGGDAKLSESGGIGIEGGNQPSSPAKDSKDSSGMFASSPPAPSSQPALRPNPSEDTPSNEAGSGGERKPYNSPKGKYLPPHTTTTPVRNIEAGPFVMEFWVEEAEGKEEAVRAAKAEMEEGEGESQS
ncbi:hypothetical protein MMC30_002621 [Trapelia coarctata]|nr:hypothetical protein [Trapelia coarctata]